MSNSIVDAVYIQELKDRLTTAEQRVQMLTEGLHRCQTMFREQSMEFAWLTALLEGRAA